MSRPGWGFEAGFRKDVAIACREALKKGPPKWLAPPPGVKAHLSKEGRRLSAECTPKSVPWEWKGR